MSDLARQLLLAIDTCGANGSVALGAVGGAGAVDAGAVAVLACIEIAGRTYSARLIPAIAQALAQQRVTVRDLAAIVVVNGPGSFTGIRVGLSAAKALAEAADKPLIALSRLALLAHVSGLPHALAVSDAGRGEFYVGEYRHGAVVRELLLSASATAEVANEPGAGVLLCEEQCPGAVAGCSPLYVQPPDAADALALAVPRLTARAFDDLATLDANYLRRSDAELFARAK